MKPFRNFLPLVRAGVDFVFPPLCVACHAQVLEGDALCAECFSKLDPIVAPFCQKCGRPFLSDCGFSLYCVSCTLHPPRWQAARAGLVYNELGRNLVLKLKYHEAERVAPVFAKFMFLAAQTALRPTDFVVPVPLHLNKLRQRGYNQSIWLGKFFAKMARLPFVPDLLQRLVSTESLGRRGAQERRKILKNTIIFHKKYLSSDLRGRRAILVDDVLSSGATAEACTEALKRFGCPDILVVTALRGQVKNDSLR